MFLLAWNAVQVSGHYAAAIGHNLWLLVVGIMTMEFCKIIS